MGQRSKYRKFTEADREMAVRRLMETDNVSELSREIRISRQLLYKWRDRLQREKEKQDARDQPLRQENAQLRRALAEKTLELNFLKGALQNVEALRQAGSGSGETASTSKFGT